LGAAGVLSTLWQVDDGATALLVSKFYDLHLSEGLEPPTALKSAQAWLREATTAELIVYVRSAIAKCPVEDRELMEKFENSIRRGQPRNSSVSSSIQWTNVKSDDTGKHSQDRDGESVRQDRPFAHPYYWGSFIYTGL
jgi:CHAT domain-containing protein